VLATAHAGIHEASLVCLEGEEELSLWTIMYKMTGYNIAAFLNLFVTAAAFPGACGVLSSSQAAAACRGYAALRPRGF
jgi:hypothetical protein